MLEPIRIAALLALLAGCGATLLLSHLRWFKRPSLVNRLLPFSSGVRPGPAKSASQSLSAVLLPRFSVAAERLAKVMGVDEPLAHRLTRAGWSLTPPEFRTKQGAWAALAGGLGLLLVIALRPPLPLVPLALAGLPFLAFLVLEQQLITATKDRQKRVFEELPVVAEQLAMLLAAGYSVGGALNRIAERNSGVTGADLRQVCERVRLGLSTTAALREWADTLAVPELHQLVAVVTISDETGDIGRMVGEEAKAIRREAQRQLVEQIERRGQQVWIPVTVATLVPGVIFLIIPFLQALQLFSSN